VLTATVEQRSVDETATVDNRVAAISLQRQHGVDTDGDNEPDTLKYKVGSGETPQPARRCSV
jgi:hypothetical protein